MKQIGRMVARINWLDRERGREADILHEKVAERVLDVVLLARFVRDVHVRDAIDDERGHVGGDVVEQLLRDPAARARRLLRARSRRRDGRGGRKGERERRGECAGRSYMG